MEFKYETLKFKKNPSKLDNENLEFGDFEIRNLLIDEYKDELHVYFSKRVASDIISIFFMFFALIVVQFHFNTFLSLSFGIISFVFLSLRIKYIKKYKKIMKMFKMSLSLVESSIKKDTSFEFNSIF